MVLLKQTFEVMKCQKKMNITLALRVYNYWFCYENGQEKLSAGLFRRMQIQNEKDKND